MTVVPDSHAASAEVEPGDVILEVNGEEVSNTRQMLDAVAKSPRKMKFVLKCGKTGRIWNLEAKLRE